MKRYVCDICGYVYDPAVGDEDGGIRRERPLKTFQTTGCAPFADRGKIPFHPNELR